MLAALLHDLADRRAVLSDGIDVIALLGRGGCLAASVIEQLPVERSIASLLARLLTQLGGNLGERRHNTLVRRAFGLPIGSIAVRATQRLNRRTRNGCC